MNDSHSRHGPSPRRLAVIGGGITGLAAAHRLTELEAAATVTLFEAGGRVGGVLRTEEHEGYLLEHSADSFITSADWAVDLCRRIGFSDQLIPTNAAWRRAFIVRDGRLHAVPDGFSLLAASRLWPLLTTRLLSLRGKLRLVLEPFVPVRRSQSDESLASFARRRLGGEAFERLVQPLVAGIYTADAEQLSMAAALPRFVEMERRHGSLLRAARLAAAGHDGGRGTPGEDHRDAGAEHHEHAVQNIARHAHHHPQELVPPVHRGPT
ncbi:MAG: protoporphyrinogen oxidase, partial [Pirellulales bacterium]